MARCSLYAVAAAATVVLAACSEREPETPTGPQFDVSDPCSFSNSLVTNYFPSSTQAFMLSLKQSMGNAGHGTASARTYGFQIMDSIGSLSRTSSVTASAGADLTIALIGCMFDDAASFTYPTTAVSDFTKALTNATGGAYYVRGGGTNGADASGRSAAIVGRISPPGGVEGNQSVIRPSSGSWTTMLSGNTGKTVNEGVLFYGYPVSASPNPIIYEWATVPSALTFSPVAYVSVCDNDLSSTSMVFEDAVGVLFNVANVDICSSAQSLTMIQPGWGPKALAGRLVHALANALTPAPLQATTVLSGKTSTASGIPKSKFSKKSVTSVSVGPWKYDPGIPSTWYGTAAQYARLASAYVNAVTPDGNLSVRFCAYLSGTNNNGTPTKLVKVTNPQQDPECTNPPNGDPNALSVVTSTVSASQSLADFGLIYVTKTGTITFTLTVVSGAGINGSLSSQANVKPPLKK